MYAREHGQPYDQGAYARRVCSAVADVVRRQVEAGVDIVCDGEQGKPGFFAYVSERLAGFEPRETTSPAGPWAGSREALAFPEYYQWYARGRPGSVAAPFGMACTGPISYKGQAALQTDIDNLKAALQGLPVEEAFMPAVAPTTIEPSRRNEYYPTQEAYLYALAEAMREEYHGIVDVGFLLQIDDPRLVTSYGSHPGMSLEEFLKWAELRVEVLNYALRDIPPEKVRFHTCSPPTLNSHKVATATASHCQPARLVILKQGRSTTGGRPGALGAASATTPGATHVGQWPPGPSRPPEWHSRDRPRCVPRR
jgi:5-methyltetrahydropteroyltriglutamate--homocysteine methyltransferase